MQQMPGGPWLRCKLPLNIPSTQEYAEKEGEAVQNEHGLVSQQPERHHTESQTQASRYLPVWSSALLISVSYKFI